MIMAYTYDASENSGLVKEGDYEATLERMERRTLPSGKEKLSIMYRIRSDVEGQSYGNKCIFEDIWEEKDNPGVFNRKRLNQLFGTQEIEDGTSFETITDVINFLTGCNLIIHIEVVLDEYRGEDVNRVAYYRSSKVKPQVLGVGGGNEPKEEKTPALEGIIDDEEVPF